MPTARTFIDQIDAEREAHDWMMAMVPEGRERVFWALERKQFAQPSEGGSVAVLRCNGVAKAAAICVRNDMNQTNLIRWIAAAPSAALVAQPQQPLGDASGPGSTSLRSSDPYRGEARPGFDDLPDDYEVN